MDEQNAQTTKQVEEAVASLSLSKSSESVSSASVTSGSIVDVDSGNEKDISSSHEGIQCMMATEQDYDPFEGKLGRRERRLSVSQGSKLH